MRVERAKNKEIDKPNVRLNKNESSIFNSSNQLKTINSPPPSANGVFAKILDEAKKDAKTGRSERTAEKSSENTPESTKLEKDVSRQTQEKNELEKEKGNDEQNQSGGENDDENAFPTSFPNLQPTTKSNEFSTPAARSILHIADLERIVSTIRHPHRKIPNESASSDYAQKLGFGRFAN